jgi:glycosyltransferase involved in cell wall biosynthesis
VKPAAAAPDTSGPPPAAGSVAPLAVAVVIPAYRCAGTIARAVRSALAQTLPPAEIVVVDDGSPDDIPGALIGLPVRCLRRDNGGPGAARNTGIRATKAPLVAFLDADDTWEPDKLRLQVERLLAAPEAVAVCSDAWVADGRGGRVARSAGRALPERIAVEALLGRNPVALLTAVVRREALEQAGLFDEDRRAIAVEDLDLWLRLALLGPILAVPAPLATYHRTEGGLSVGPEGGQRFLQGTDYVYAKFLARHPARADWRGLVRLARAQSRRDASWECLRAGRFGRAALLALRALAHAPGSGAAWRLLLRAVCRWRPYGSGPVR